MKLPSLLFGLFLLSCGGDGDGSSAAGGGGASGGVSGSGGASGNGGAGTGGSAGSGGASSALGLGLLPLRVTHNLETDTCLATSSCSANVEVESEEAAFLKKVEADVNLPVLHWDRAIPWLAFTETAPTGSDRVAFYDAKLDPALRDWLNAFDVYFAALGGGYVALTPLHGSRDKLKQLRLPDGSEVDVGNVCNDVSPGTIVTLDLSAKGLGTVQLDIATAFRNFVLYVHDKLEPSYLAIGIELTLFEKSCPAEWPGLVSLYQSTYDAVRAEVPAATKIFATLTAQELLGFDHDACFGAFDFQPCSGPPGASYAAFDDAKCFPLHTQPIDDLDAGGRLDVLALSFYPDGFLTKRSGLENGLLEIWPSATGGTGDCALHAELPPAVDPIAALAKLGWKKPIAIAETSARSCESWTWLKAATGDLTLRVPGNDAAQTAWLEAMTGAGKDQSWLFVIGSFYADYPPMGPWIPAQDPAILDPFTFQAFNAFPCMGLYTPAGAPKASQLAVWKQALTP